MCPKPFPWAKNKRKLFSDGKWRGPLLVRVALNNSLKVLLFCVFQTMRFGDRISFENEVVLKHLIRTVDKCMNCLNVPKNIDKQSSSKINVSPYKDPFISENTHQTQLPNL